MKKIFTFLLMTILSFGIGFADTVTISFDFATIGTTGWNQSYTSHTVSSNDFTISLAESSKQSATITDVPVTKKGVITVSQTSTAKTITGVKLTLKQWTNKSKTVRLRTSSDGTILASSNTFSLEYNGLSTDVLYFDWSETNNQVGIVSLELTYSGGTTIATPVISGTTPFETSTEVSISCSTTGTTIYYTTNGSDPTNNSSVYSAPFTINSSCTVKAIAYKGTQKSSIASKEFKALPHVSTIEELNALDNNETFIMDGDVVCIWHYNQYTYIQDDTEASLIYGALPENINYKITDVIPGGWKGTKTTYSGFPGVINASDFIAAEEKMNIPATELDLSNISQSDWGKYVVAKNVLITTSGGGGDNPPVGETVTFDFNNGLSDLGLTTPEVGTGTNLESAITYGGVTMSFTNGGTATRIWNSSGTTTLRVYKGGSLTFTSSANFTSIVFDGTVSVNTDVGTWTGSSKTWTGNSNSVTLTISSNSTINSIVFTFASNSSAPLRAQAVSGNYTLTDENGNTLTAYPTKLGVTDIPDDLTQRYDAYGVLDYHNGNPQLLPIGFIDKDGVVTSIVNPTVNEINDYKYFDITGRYVGTDITILPAGLYIRNDGMKILK